MNKNNKPTNRAPKKLTVADLKQVIGGLANRLDPTVEGTEVEDTSGNNGTGSSAKADSDS